MSDLNDRRKVVFRSTRTDRIRAVLALGAVLGLGSVSTMAAWTDTATATSGLFSTGTLDIKANDQDTHSFVALSMADMVPGSTKNANLVVKNAGTAALTYTMRAVVSGDDTLGQHVRATVYADACSGTALAGPTPMRSTQSPIAMLGTRGPLAASAQQTLCFSVALNQALWDQTNWPTALQAEGKAVDVSFEFIATAS